MNTFLFTVALLVGSHAGNAYILPLPGSLPSGQTFTREGTSNRGYEGAKETAVASSEQSCASHSVQRLSAWKLLGLQRYRFPGKCVVVGGQKYCQPDDEGAFYTVSAVFRCR